MNLLIFFIDLIMVQYLHLYPCGVDAICMNIEVDLFYLNILVKKYKQRILCIRSSKLSYFFSKMECSSSYGSVFKLLDKGLILTRSSNFVIYFSFECIFT